LQIKLVKLLRNTRFGIIIDQFDVKEVNKRLSLWDTLLWSMTAALLCRHALFSAAHQNSPRKTAVARGSMASFETKPMESLN
jgi:hypothetical protein